MVTKLLEERCEAAAAVENSERYKRVREFVSVIIRDLWHNGLLFSDALRAATIDLLFSVYYEKNIGKAKIYEKTE